MGFKSCLTFVLLLVFALGAKISWSLVDDDDHLKSIRQHCGFTRYPVHCMETLAAVDQQLLTQQQQNPDIIFFMVEKIRYETLMLPPYPSNQSYYVELHKDHHAQASSIGYCEELMKLSLKHIDQSLLALKDSPVKRKHDIQTWLSAVLTFQHTCEDSIKGFSGVLVDEMSSKMNQLTRLASNSLALVNRIVHNEPPKNRHLTSSDDEPLIPLWVSREGRRLLQKPTTGVIQANAVVAKDGTGNYKTVTEAINAASGGRFVIHVKSGVYNEKINCKKDGITLIGDGKYSTIIANNPSVGAGSNLHDAATFAITGDGFMARDIGFQNTAGPSAGQAPAMRISSDRSVLYRCSIAGYQDTLYAHALRQFYRECDIYGTIDFIFGNAAAVFQTSTIVLRRPRSGGFNAILANGREDPGQNTGFSLQRCKITTSPDLTPSKHSVESYLGRPWKKYSRAVVMQSMIDDAIKPGGWIEWDGSFALSTLYFAEYLNSGPGAGTSGRVKWSRSIGPEVAVKFTVGSFIGGTAWLPSTGVAFNSGLE